MKKNKLSAAALAVVASVLMWSGSAAADSAVIKASGGQCEATWQSAPNRFRVRDNDLHDSDYCYVVYAFNRSLSNASRWNRAQDVGGYAYFGVGGSHSLIYFKVCKERQNDPDICSSVWGGTF